MPLKFLFDEQLRGSPRRAVSGHARKFGVELDIVEVGQPGVVATGTPDPQVLEWAATEHRILVTLDKKTMPTHIADHLKANHPCAGVIILLASLTAQTAAEYLVLASEASEEYEWVDRVQYVG